MLNHHPRSNVKCDVQALPKYDKCRCIILPETAVLTIKNGVVRLKGTSLSAVHDGVKLSSYKNRISSLKCSEETYIDFSGWACKNGATFDRKIVKLRVIFEGNIHISSLRRPKCRRTQDQQMMINNPMTP